MDYHKGEYFARRTFGTDEDTGLQIEVRAVGLIADAINKEITITLHKVLVTTTGAVMEILDTYSYKRYNSQLHQKYDDLKESEIGIGIQQMIEYMDLSLIESDLSNFPQVLAQE